MGRRLRIAIPGTLNPMIAGPERDAEKLQDFSDTIVLQHREHDAEKLQDFSDTIVLQHRDLWCDC